MTILYLRLLLDLRPDFNRFCCFFYYYYCCCICCAPSNWQMCINTQMQCHLNVCMCRQLSIQRKWCGLFFGHSSQYTKIALDIKTNCKLQCISMNREPFERCSWPFLVGQTFQNFIIVNRWHEHSCKTPPHRLSLLQNHEKKTFIAHRKLMDARESTTIFNWNQMKFYSIRMWN